MAVTKTTTRALEIIKEHGRGVVTKTGRTVYPMTPKQFAELMWPKSSGWQRVAKCGPNGAHIGGGMYLAAGGYLARLEKRDLIRHSALGYYLTGKGQVYLNYALST